MAVQGPGATPLPLSVDDEVLDDLSDRIRRTRGTDSVTGTGWLHGTCIDYLRELADFWVDGFDWRLQERLLNDRLPGWGARMDGRLVHFARCPGVGPSPLPLVLLHGWPGSFAEMSKIAPLLADPARFGGNPADAFDVGVPSLPGHGLSESVLRPGFGADQCADVIHALMTEVVGVSRFGAQGGDRGRSSGPVSAIDIGAPCSGSTSTFRPASPARVPR